MTEHPLLWAFTLPLIAGTILACLFGALFVWAGFCERRDWPFSAFIAPVALGTWAYSGFIVYTMMTNAGLTP